MSIKSSYNVLGIRFSGDSCQPILCLEFNNNYYEIEFKLSDKTNGISTQSCNCFSRKVQEFQGIDIIPIEEMIIRLPCNKKGFPFFYEKEDKNKFVIKDDNKIIFEYKRTNGSKNGFFVWNEELFEDLRAT